MLCDMFFIIKCYIPLFVLSIPGPGHCPWLCPDLFLYNICCQFIQIIIVNLIGFSNGYIIMSIVCTLYVYQESALNHMQQASKNQILLAPVLPPCLSGRAHWDITGVLLTVGKGKNLTNCANLTHLPLLCSVRPSVHSGTRGCHL